AAMLKSQKPKQLALPFVRAKRRRMKVSRAQLPHVARALHRRREPAHVTLRRRDGLPNLREQRLFQALRGALSRAARAWFRVIEFSVQSNHVHLIVEADDTTSLSRGMTGVCVRLAR